VPANEEASGNESSTTTGRLSAYKAFISRRLTSELKRREGLAESVQLGVLREIIAVRICGEAGASIKGGEPSEVGC
jgi:hypothetical protein